MPLPEILSVEDVAVLFDCDPLTVQSKTTVGELPGLKIGRSWKYPRDALLSSLNQQALEQAKDRATPPTPTAVRVGRRTTPVSLPKD